MTLLEQAARALHEHSRAPIIEFALSRGLKSQAEVDLLRPPWEGLPPSMKCAYLDAVSAVLLASREPSEAMLSMVAIFGGHRLTEFEKRQLWRTMIDLAITP